MYIINCIQKYFNSLLLVHRKCLLVSSYHSKNNQDFKVELVLWVSVLRELTVVGQEIDSKTRRKASGAGKG